MKTKYLFIGLLLCFSSCALFKKASKTSNTISQSSSKQLEADMQFLKKANKETQVFTYWNDSGFYQIAQIREQVDQSGSGRIKGEEKEDEKTKVTAMQTEPGRLLVYVGIVLAVFGLCLVYRRL